MAEFRLFSNENIAEKLKITFIICDNLRMVQILDGKKLSKKILEKIAENVQEAAFSIKLASIYNEKNPGSKMYVGMKVRRAASVGIDSEEFKIDDTWNTDQVLRLIDKLNHDDSVSGILVQSPLGQHIDESAVFNAISPIKDVDGLTAYNQGLLFENAEEKHVVSATPAGVMALLKAYDYSFTGKNALVIGRSVLFGRPMSILLTNADMTVTLAHSKTPTDQLQQFAQTADLIVVAVGKANWFQLDHLKATATVIDVGANKLDGQTVGDVDFQKTAAQVSWITPVPGGVGPMTIATLIQHTYELAKFQHRGE